MIQVIPFNPAQGGTTPNLCLANVCLGFGIPNKYGSAWEAWQHTQQHTDPVPDGLDVPLYYSYSVNLGQGVQNYGHINVRLANGTVWSDGNIYASIDAYLANHWPKYVGWGESINDVKIIEGDTMGLTHDQVAKICVMACDLQPEVSPAFMNNIGLDLDAVLDNFLNYTESRNLRLDAEAYRAGQTGGAKPTKLAPGLYEV
jgi:hypothetical protein